MAAGLEEDIFDAGTGEDPGQDPRPDLAPVQRTPEDRAISHAIREIGRQAGGREPAPQPQPPAPKPDQGPQVTDPQTGERVPLAVLLEERSARQDAIRQNQELQRQLQRYQQQEEQAKQPKTPIAQRLFEEPEGVLTELEQRIMEQAVRPLQTQLSQMTIQHDMSLASIRHQDIWPDAWNAWFGHVSQQQDPVTYFRVMNAASPGEELVSWFKEQRMRQEIGDDPQAYRERLRQELLQELQGGGAPQVVSEPPPAQNRASNGQFTPKQQVRLPTATSRMGNSGNSGSPLEDADGSEDAIFESARPRSRRDR